MVARSASHTAARFPARLERLQIAEQDRAHHRRDRAGRRLSRAVPAGYGSTGPHVKPGLTITEAQAEELLRQDVARFEVAVADMAKVATDNQFAAMVSLAFNVGAEALRKSTLLRKHNAGDYTGARAEFARWKFAGGKVLGGLVRRRAAEAKLYGTA